MNPRTVAVALLLLVSGMCGLVFEMVWLRELRLIFGSSTMASAAALAIFMGGLGLGSAVLGQRADISANPLQLFARLELGISVTAMISPLLIALSRIAYIATGGQETLGVFGATLCRLFFATLVLGLPTFLMGGTLPAAARAVTLPDDRSRRDVGLLYSLNSLGAVAGAAMSTFLLLEWIGSRATLWAACAVSLLNALIAWNLARRWTLGADSTEWRAETSSGHGSGLRFQGGVKSKNRHAAVVAATHNSETTHEHHSRPATSPIALYVTAAVAGFVFLLMELVWYRMLGPILGGTTFTFGLILVVALAGIGFGGAIFRAMFRERAPDLLSLALTLALEALALAVPFALGDRLAILATALRSLGNYAFSGHVFGWLLITSIVVFPAAVISGIQIPLLIALIGQGNHRVGKQVGRILACNTAGAIAGSLAGGFGLLTQIGAIGAWKLAVIALAATAVTLLFLALRHPASVSRFLPPVFFAAASGFCLLAAGPTAVWRHSGIGAGRADMPTGGPNELKAWMNANRRNVMWEIDGRESSVAISSRKGAGFIINGKSDGDAVNDAGTQVMLGVLGALLHPQAQDGLVIGLGTGESAGWLAHQPGIGHVDVVELEPAIRQVATVCGLMNHDVMRHPQVDVVFNDARELLLTTRQEYDLIASEPSNPYRSGVSSLYSREFYAAARQRLRPDGLFLQWLQGYEIDIPTFRTVLCTLSSVFEHVEIWETSPADMVLVCSVDPLQYTAADLKQRMSEPAMRDALRVAWRTTTLEGVLAHLVATEQFASAVAGQRLGRVNTDDANVLEYRFARTVGRAAGFTVTGLRADAASIQADRHLRLNSEVDWEAVEDARIAYHAANDTPLSPRLFAGASAARAEALFAFANRSDLALIARFWNSQPKPPRDLIETVAVALGRASIGDAEALNLAESIRADCPLEADVIAAVLAAQQGKHGDSVAALTGVFTALRKDPTPMPGVVDVAVRAALQVADQDPRQTKRLYEALREPFAVLMAQDRRITALCLLSQRLGPSEAVEAFAMTEPHTFWEVKMLELRAGAYEQTGNPLSDIARRELADFRANASESSVLRQN